MNMIAFVKGERYGAIIRMPIPVPPDVEKDGKRRLVDHMENVGVTLETVIVVFGAGDGVDFFTIIDPDDPKLTEDSFLDEAWGFEDDLND